MNEFWERYWEALMCTPGDDVLRYIQQLYPKRHIPEARGALKLWLAVHRAQEAEAA